MTTFEMVCWAILAILVFTVLGGLAFLVWSNKATCSESDRLVAKSKETDSSIRVLL